MSKRLNAIRSVLNSYEQRPYTGDPDLSSSLTYALLLCLTDDELIDAYWDFVDRKHIQGRIESLILRRVADRGHGPFVRLLEELYEALETADWNRYRGLRKFLSMIIRSFPEPSIRAFFDYFLDHGKYGDQAKAFGVAELVWSREIEDILWEKLDSEADDMCFRILLKKGDLNRFQGVFQDLWRSDSVPSYFKNTLLKHFAERNFESVAFLRSETPLSYLYAVILAGKKIPPREAQKIVAAASDEREYGFAIWCLGKLGMWNELLDLNARIPEIEKEFRHARLRRLGVTEFDEFD